MVECLRIHLLIICLPHPTMLCGRSGFDGDKVVLKYGLTGLNWQFVEASTSRFPTDGGSTPSTTKKRVSI